MGIAMRYGGTGGKAKNAIVCEASTWERDVMVRWRRLKPTLLEGEKNAICEKNVDSGAALLRGRLLEPPLLIGANSK
jgi:hypothetical protein